MNTAIASVVAAKYKPTLAIHSLIQTALHAALLLCNNTNNNLKCADGSEHIWKEKQQLHAALPRWMTGDQTHIYTHIFTLINAAYCVHYCASTWDWDEMLKVKIGKKVEIAGNMQWWWHVQSVRTISSCFWWWTVEICIANRWKSIKAKQNKLSVEAGRWAGESNSSPSPNVWIFLPQHWSDQNEKEEKRKTINKQKKNDKKQIGTERAMQIVLLF